MTQLNPKNVQFLSLDKVPLVRIDQRVSNRYGVRGLHRPKIRLQAKGWFIQATKNRHQ